MVQVALDVSRWAEENFGTCELGDARRTRRAVKVAEQMAQHPDGGTPAQTENWPELKAVYRLFDAEDVTFSALAEPHWKQTRAAATGTVLLLGDTMETDFGIHRQIEGLGPTGDGGGRGFMLHSSLMVSAESGEIIGLAGQEIFYRQPAPEENETSYQKSKRARESEVWGRVIDQVGPPAASVRYIHVFDRGADNLEVFCHARRQRSDWVIRAAQLQRTVWDESGECCSLGTLLKRRPIQGIYAVQVPLSKNQPKRVARMEARFAQVTIKRPRRPTAYLREIEFEELTQWVVEAREIGAPPGVEPLHWVLWTSLPVTSLEEALEVVRHYEKRWLIEEFHKAIKTGCGLESRQYMTAGRLEAVAGITCVLAIRLLQLKTVARTQPELPAERIVPKTWLLMLRALRKRPIHSIRDFFRHLAGLGGFLMRGFPMRRGRDGEPGWITLWRGLDKLLLAVRGHQAMLQRCG